VVAVTSKTAWWYRDRWWDQSAFDITRKRGPKRWFEFTGTVDWDWGGSNVWTTYSLARVLSTYGISANRTPPTGRYESAPRVEFQNLVAAKTQDAKKFLFWDSNDPSVRVGVDLIHQVHNDGPATSSPKRRSKTIVEVSNEANSPLNLGNLNGGASFEPITFNLHEEFPVRVFLDVRFTYYVEGDAKIDMGDQRWPFKMRIPQYDIVPA
jgi:hypothetical protein